MRTYYKIKWLALLIGLMWMTSCDPPWQDHYNNLEESVNMKLWDAIKQDPRYSSFVSLIEAAELDSLFDRLKTAQGNDWKDFEQDIWAEWSKSGSPAMDARCRC